MGLRSYTTPADGANGSLLISESQKGDAENQGAQMDQKWHNVGGLMLTMHRT